MKRNFLRTLTISAFAAPSLFPAISHAQLEEIIVTAQKRAQSQQDIGIAITAMSADGLERSGIMGTDELSVVTPGLQAGRTNGNAMPFIRGVGSNSSTVGTENSVAMYIDGVYHPALMSGVQDFNNLERIEVLKGPQGTLFGRNATGGLIHIITGNPEYDPSMSIHLGYGNYDTTTTNFYGTMGITDSIATDLSVVTSNSQQGWGKNLATGRDITPEKSTSVRSKWLFEPSDATSIILSLTYSEKEGASGAARQPMPGTQTALGATYTGDWHDIESDLAGGRGAYYDTQQQSANLTIRHSFDAMDFVSITSYIDAENFNQIDQDTSAQPAIPPSFLPMDIFGITTDETVAQEFQLVSTNDGDFNWTVGALYMLSKSGYDPSSLARPGEPSFVDVFVDNETESFAIFGEMYYDFTESLSMTLGARFTQDKRDVKGRTDLPGAGLALPFKGSEDWTEPTWKLGLDYRVNDNILTYFSYSRGFRSGTYNTFVTSGILPDPVEPEIIDAYEIGMKSDLLDNTLRLNLSAFYYDYDDLQYEQSIAGAVILLNAAAAEIKGFDIESVYSPTENLNLRLSASFLDAEYKDFENGPVYTLTPSSGNIVTAGDLSGNKMIRTPDFTYGIAADYRIPISSGEVTLAANYYYNDGFYWLPDNRIKQKSYDIVNASASFTTRDNKWVFKVFGSNLFDEEYSYYTSSVAFGDMMSAAPPRLYGVSVGLNF